MLKTIFSKTLYEKRWMQLAWGIGLLALVMLTMAFYPTFKETFGESLKNVPEGLKSFLGDAAAYQTIEGFIDLQILSQMVFMTIIMGVILGTGLIAGEENDGTLQTLLSYPVSRGRVYVQKLVACLTIVGVICFVVFIGMVVGSLLVGESISLGPAFLSVVMLWLVTLAFSLLGFSLGAITGRRGLSGAVAGALAFVTFMITSLAPSVPALKIPNYFSPFYYHNNPSVLRSGLEWGDLVILVTINIIFVVLGYIVFVRRDVYQK
jgi:ABC-2 type transport system permease protein